MFKVKAKTNSVKLKDINKYIGRVWTVLTEAEVKKSKDLYANRNKFVIQTNIPELQEKFGLNRTATIKSPVKNVSIVQQDKMFVAKPEEIPPEKEEKVFIAEPPKKQDTKPNEDKFTLEKVFDAEDSDIKLNLMADIEEEQVQQDLIAEELKPTDASEEKISNNIEKTNDEADVLVNNILNISDIDIEDKFKQEIEKNSSTQIKNEETTIYNTNNVETNTETPRRRRGRPPKSPQ